MIRMEEKRKGWDGRVKRGQDRAREDEGTGGEWNGKK